jgi:hypothetical protein
MDALPESPSNRSSSAKGVMAGTVIASANTAMKEPMRMRARGSSRSMQPMAAAGPGRTAGCKGEVAGALAPHARTWTTRGPTRTSTNYAHTRGCGPVGQGEGGGGGCGARARAREGGGVGDWSRGCAAHPCPACDARSRVTCNVPHLASLCKAGCAACTSAAATAARGASQRAVSGTHGVP